MDSQSLRLPTPTAQISLLIKILLKTFDFIIIPGCIIWLAYDPNCLHGHINYFESGQYLAAVNGIFHNKIPVRDFLVLFGPLQAYSIAFAMYLFGKTVAVLRAFFFMQYILGFLIIYLLGMRVCKNRLFAYLIPFVCLIEVGHPYWATRWDYGRMGLGLLILFMLINAVEKNNSKSLFIAGVLSGITVFYTVDIGVISIISGTAYLLLSALYQDGGLFKYDAQKSARYTLSFAAGIACVSIPMLLFLFSRGGLLDYIRTTFFIIPVATFKVWGQAIPKFNLALKIYMPVIFYSSVFCYLLLSFVNRIWNKEKGTVALLFIYGLMVYRAAFRSIEGPQFQVALPPLIILSALFLRNGVNRLVIFCKGFAVKTPFELLNIAKAAFAAVLIIIGIAYFIISPKRYYEDIGGWIKYQTAKKELLATFTHPYSMADNEIVISSVPRIGASKIPSWQEDVILRVVIYLTENTVKDEEIFCFPDKGIFNFIANRPSFSRFYTPGSAWTTPEWRKELLRELAVKKPRSIILSTRLSHMATAIGRSEEIFPEAIKYINSNYHVVKEYGDISILEINKN